ncbi:MAG: metal ABC transporter solute-binding protein, Zn/Mn family [Yaniella sp.]|uniref:metal ABC transporter solute-binding protein, Zn/Mn family n=1 Tax=Yaniella sp. TaxID=2773929 RepID=UPI003F9B7D0C
MNKRHVTTSLAALGALLLAGCSSGDDQSVAQDEQIQAVSTFSILSDIVAEIGADHVKVHNIVPVGNDPHEYSATPEDTKAMSNADAYFYNGLNLEGGENGWAARMVESVGLEEDRVFETTEGVKPMYLTEVESDQSINPHAFLDPNVGIIMAENVAAGLIDVDPDHAEEYKQNLEDYVQELTEVDKRYQHEIGDLEEDRRVLVTSERAYQYMADSYNLLEGYIWAVDTDDIGTPDQMISAIDFVNEHEPKALFVESNVTPGPMETVSEETGVEIYATIFSDELASKGEPGDTYLGFLEENLQEISEGLQQ